MKNKILFVLVLVLSFSFYSKVSANELCSSTGYSIYTINGINTNEVGAIKNMNSLKSKFSTIYNNQPLKVDYLYNPTHIGGTLDILDVIAQGVFDQKSDYDLTNMLSDASQKMTTQKVLLVGHSQGNFYANNFYDKVADKEGGVPSESIGVYGVASPASYVAGGGKYLTSDTDVVINKVAGRIMNVLKPNTHIALQNGDDYFGHDFSGVYLKYQGDRIVSEIRSSLDKLKNNDEQDPEDPCISLPKITAFHKAEGVLLAAADFIVGNNIFTSISNDANNLAKAIGNGAHSLGLAIGNIFGGLSANVVQSLSDRSLITTLPLVDSVSESEPTNSNSSQEQNTANQNQISQSAVAPVLVADAPAVPPTTAVISGVGSNTNSSQVREDNSTKNNNTNNSGGDSSGTNGSTAEPDKKSTTTDITPPIITIIGDNPMSLIKGSVYTDAGATANDETDGVLTVTSTGIVDTNTIGIYTITYSASDSSNNVVTSTRTINVVADTSSPVAPSSTLDTTPPVITVLGNNPEVVTVGSVYTDAGATASDNVDGVRTVDVSGTVDTTKIGDYVITYTTSDVAGNISTATRDVRVSTYKYVPKYKFGNDNGDGNDWQVWAFNGSNIYDWSDTYINNYLHEQFKIQTYSGGYWCSQCLQRGIFNHDPQKGFETSDLVTYGLDGNPQNSMKDETYDVVLQWDSTGYTYTISHGNIVDNTGHRDIANVNENMWAGWDDTTNNFQTFPSGRWYGRTPYSPVDRTGGDSMVLQPFPVYKMESISTLPTLSLPNKGSHAGTGIDPTRGRANLTQFNFQIVYTDPNNISPQNVTLHITNTTTGALISSTAMSEVPHGNDNLSDGNFTNGELYIADSLYETGDYSYYFSANDNQGRELRMPENGFLRFTVVPSTYTYVPKYKFGNDNGDGHNWQVWAFTGSNIYDWSDTYVNKYLKEQFKIQTYSGGYWCSQCLQRGIFNHDPQKGFETNDVSLSRLEGSPQSNEINMIYNIVTQWDSSGYTYTISHDNITDATGHTDVPKINNNFWVGWDETTNNFQTSPSGTWEDSVYGAPGFTGGLSMMLQPYPIYSENSETENNTEDPVVSPVIHPVEPSPTLSSLKAITAFSFAGLNPEVSGIINETDHTISLAVPYGTDVTTLIPTVIISDKASASPNNNIVQNFTSPVTYTVTAEDNSTQNYVVTVTVAPNPNPPLDITPPSITNYTLNGNTGSVTVNPLNNPISLFINASENVNWTSIRIEKQDDPSVYKIFYSGTGCINGTNTCTKTWDGNLSKGSFQDGTFRIKVHMKDSANNEFNDYLSPYVINVNSSI